MEQLNILRYFNSKCKNKLVLVPKYMDFLGFYWNFAQFALAHEYWVMSAVA